MEEQRAQRVDMVRMRIEHELEVQGLIMRMPLSSVAMLTDEMVEVRRELWGSLRPLFDAKYGELREVRYPLPKCEICGEVAETGSAFCALCWQECPECGGRGGGGFVAEPRGEGGQNATESPCGGCR